MSGANVMMTVSLEAVAAAPSVSSSLVGSATMNTSVVLKLIVRLVAASAVSSDCGRGTQVRAVVSSADWGGQGV